MMRAHTLVGPSEYAGGDAAPQPPAEPWFLRFQLSCLPVASPKGPPWAAAHGFRAAVRCRLPLQRPLGRTISQAHRSMPPSGAQAVHSTSPSGTKVGICAVARKYCATRCHRVARPSRTRRHRVARKSAYAQLPENIVPLDATGWHAHRALDVTEWHGRALRIRRPQPRTSPAAHPRVCKDVWGGVTEPPSDAPHLV